MKKETIEKIYKIIGLVFGSLLLAVNYNLFLLPNNLVIGGTSGLSIIFKNIIDPTLFINVATIALLLLGYLFLGKDYTKKTIIGSVLFLVFVSLTKGFCNNLVTRINIDEFIVTVILVGILYGVSNGIIFKTGYTTGGTDVIIKLLTKYLKIPEGKSTTYTNATIILLGGISFGIARVIYAFFVLYISSYLIDKIMIGISDSKVFYVYTTEGSKVKDVILETFKTGFTILPTLGGYSHEKGELIMCVVNSRDYYQFKELVLKIDPNAFMLINDCYDVNGGVKKQNLPFM